MFITINKNYVSEITIKKSRFIASLFYVEKEEEANKLINLINKKYYDAKHNCFAYRIYDNGNIKERFSDNGEPSGTAGQPILNVLKGKNLQNVLVIVTRYFGGILLGTGGLVKAYTEVTQKVLEDIKIIKKEIGKIVKLEIKYNDLENLNYYLRQNNIKIHKIDYLENVEIYLEITNEQFENFENTQNEFNFNILKKEIVNSNEFVIVE